MSQDDTTAGSAAGGDGRPEGAGEQLTVLFAFDGPAYLAPVDRGLFLTDGPAVHSLGLGLLDGDYDVSIVIRGRPGQRRGPLQPGPGLPPGFGRLGPTTGGGASG